MSGNLLREGSRSALRRPQADDLVELQRLIESSKELHLPWVELDGRTESVETYLRNCRSERSDAFLVCERTGHGIAGVFNLSEIVRGVFQSAYVSFYGNVALQGRGLMTEGLRLVIAEAFEQIGLHRLEANVQPSNERSKRLVERCGFRLEGFSPRYLKIAGEWRDHERWALTVEDTQGPLESSYGG